MTNRRPDTDWGIEDERGRVTFAGASLAVLMDIRRELKRLNAAIWCPNFIAIPQQLRAIEANTRKVKRKARAKKVKHAR